MPDILALSTRDYALALMTSLPDAGAERKPLLARTVSLPVADLPAQIELLPLYGLLNVVKVGQIHLFYRARLLDTQFAPGPETIEAQLFHEHEVPWQELAFPTVGRTLKCFFADRRAQHYPIRNEGMAPLRPRD